MWFVAVKFDKFRNKGTSYRQAINNKRDDQELLRGQSIFDFAAQKRRSNDRNAFERALSVIEINNNRPWIYIMAI